MGEIWIKEAERLGGGSIGGAMDTPSAPPRVVWHTTESGTGDTSFKGVADYLIRIGAEPHILYDPTTDRLAQYGPLNQSARALKNDGLTRTNRTGAVCIQIEVLGRAANPFTSTWQPGPNFRALMRAIRSWGVPDAWPGGALAERYNDPNVSRSRTTWATKGGHYGHSQIPGNDHWDPGAINKNAIFAAAPVTPPPADSGSTSGSASTYTVKAGDTLSGIGAKTGVKWETIASLNGIKSPYVILVGQVLKLKDSTSTAPAKPAAKPVVSVAHLNVARAKDVPAPTGHTTYPAEVKIVEDALVKEGHLDKGYADGSWGTLTDAAYNAFRRKMGYTGSAATGSVGLESLKKLAARHGFVAVA
ncbi:LysM peptidoglycan-binding domain-containing protein [Streptomyces sp. NPDC086782]|uniref:LysM peptidoglycan-binding domain-containing protein n=1 Tax=Streptomyces sp. NPDC086782 TaxID=3365757 RepID=UPI0038283353